MPNAFIIRAPINGPPPCQPVIRFLPTFRTTLQLNQPKKQQL